MARCPYAPHRLSIGVGGYCRRCNGDVRLYAAVQALPVLLFNDARRLWNDQQYETAAALLDRAIGLRPAFAAAYWLLGVLEAKRGNIEKAREQLGKARELGAPADPAWVEPEAPNGPDGAEMTPSGEELPVSADPQPSSKEPSSPAAAASAPESAEKPVNRTVALLGNLFRMRLPKADGEGDSEEQGQGV